MHSLTLLPSPPEHQSSFFVGDVIESPRGKRAQLFSPSAVTLDASEDGSPTVVRHPYKSGTVLSTSDNNFLNDHFIIVLRGRLQISYENNDDDLILNDGDIHGDVALFCPTPRHKLITCLTDCTLCILEKSDIPRGVRRGAEPLAWVIFRNTVLVSILSNIPSFSTVGIGLIKSLVHILVHRVFEPKEFILLEGSEGYQSLYIISRGDVVATVDGQPVSSFGDRGDFNVVGMLHATPRKYTLVASTTTHVFSVSRTSFTERLRQKHPNSYSTFVLRSAALFHSATLQILINAVPLFANASTALQGACSLHSSHHFSPFFLILIHLTLPFSSITI
eukprot:TRINITY_DN6401_c0_g1_i5.p1 TRINITY_DN6401_c0_g1~~TRINITY_DN6401_c0_g1_i5.p1  ORF type:complete len:334 (+),score=47.93 TRINITY_DN6401_c0_g1_i5:123-1124(+)